MGNEAMLDHEDRQLSMLLKKARRKTILRNTAISLIVSLLVLGAAAIANRQLLYSSADHALRDIWLFKTISGPNIYEGNYQQSLGILNGTLQYQTYKIIEGVPIPWNQDAVEFGIIGGFSRMPGGYSSIQVPDSELNTKKLDYYRPYNAQNGQREMLFYHPEIDYGNYLNDLQSLTKMSPNKLVEMGLSLDKAYSVDDIKKILPDGVHPVWYWVDTYYDLEQHQAQTVLVDQKMPDGSVKQVEETFAPQPEQAKSIYGFGVHSDENVAESTISEETFLQDIETGLSIHGKYYGEYKKIYDYLRKDKDKPAAADVKIIGVVVTGTAEHLKALQGPAYVKAAVLGAAVDKY